MPTFRLSKEIGPKINYLARHTHKAVLLMLQDNGELVPYWFPKSQLSIRTRDEIRIVDGKPAQTGEKITEVTIPDWLWEKRERAKGMGLD